MTSDTKPSAAAMRAAEKIVSHANYVATINVPVERVAAIIDAETGLAELATSLRWAMMIIGPYALRIKGHNDHYCDSHDRAHAALARLEGRTS